MQGQYPPQQQQGYPPQQQGYPPQQQGYPPQQQGYPPQQQGYPPQQQGYPPQQQGYPPQQQGYPPQQQVGQAYPVQNQPLPVGSAPMYTYQAPQNKEQMSNWNGTGQWVSPMCMSCCEEPMFWCFACFCPWCASYKQREKLLMGNMANYECCAGIIGRGCCSDQMRQCTTGNESCCLMLEVCCCLGCSVHGNRWMVQQHYGLENTCCDVFIMYLSCICSCLACLTGEQALQNIADLIYYIVIGCMLTQHEAQMKRIGYPQGVNVMR